MNFKKIYKVILNIVSFKVQIKKLRSFFIEKNLETG